MTQQVENPSIDGAHLHPAGTSVILPKMTGSVISAQILVLVSMRKYVLNHEEISNTIDSKIILHNYILY